MLKKVNKLEYDIIQIIFKWCESEMCPIVLLPNYKRTYGKIGMIKKQIGYLYRKLVLFLRYKNSFCYIPENDSEQDILGWNMSTTRYFCWHEEATEPIYVYLTVQVSGYQGTGPQALDIRNSTESGQG